MSNEPNTPIYYNSVFRHGVDEKRRLQIPSRWKPKQEDTELTLILWPNAGVAEACLLVLPPELMESLVGKLKAMPFFDPQAEALRRLLGRKSATVTLDKQGRICVPESMAKAAGIETEAVLVGLVDRFQIWNPARYDAANAVDDALLPEAFKLI